MLYDKDVKYSNIRRKKKKLFLNQMILILNYMLLLQIAFKIKYVPDMHLTFSHNFKLEPLLSKP